MDFVVFFLDDGVLGGSSRAVLHFCNRMEQLLADVGLSLQRAKCEVVPTAGASHQVPADTFNGFKFNPGGDFKLLGAPFGSAEFCSTHTRKRAQRAKELLEKLSGMRDAQSALHLVRHCVSFCKLAYSARAVPPSLHYEVLQDYSAEVRKTLDSVIGSDVDARGWEQAEIGI